LANHKKKHTDRERQKHKRHEDRIEHIATFEARQRVMNKAKAEKRCAQEQPTALRHRSAQREKTGGHVDAARQEIETEYPNYVCCRRRYRQISSWAYSKHRKHK